MSKITLSDVIGPDELDQLEDALRAHGFTQFEDLGHGQYQYYPETEPYEEDYMVWIGNAMDPGPDAPDVPLDEQYEIHLVDAQMEGRVPQSIHEKKLSDWRNFVRLLKVEGIQAGQ